MKRGENTGFDATTLAQETEDVREEKEKKSMERNTREQVALDEAALRKKNKRERRKKRKNVLSKGFDDGFEDSDDDGTMEGDQPSAEQRTKRQQAAAKKGKKEEEKRKAQGWSKRRTKGRKSNGNDPNAALKRNRRRAEEQRKALMMGDDSQDSEPDETPEVPTPDPEPPINRPASAPVAKKETRKEARRRKAEEKRKREDEEVRKLLDDDTLKVGTTQNPGNASKKREKNRAKKKRQEEAKKKREEDARVAKEARKREQDERKKKEEEADKKREQQEMLKREQEQAEKERKQQEKRQKRSRLAEEKRKRKKPKGATKELSEEQQKAKAKLQVEWEAKQAEQAERKANQAKQNAAKKQQKEQLRIRKQREAEAERRASEEAAKLAEEQKRIEADAELAKHQQAEADHNASSDSDSDDSWESQKRTASDLKRSQSMRSDQGNGWEDASDSDDESLPPKDQTPHTKRRQSFDDFSDADSDEPPMPTSAPEATPKPAASKGLTHQKPKFNVKDIVIREDGAQGRVMKVDMFDPDGLFYKILFDKDEKSAWVNGTGVEVDRKQGKENVPRRRSPARKPEVSKKVLKANMRSPIGVIMGHANTGKTKILDKIRNTNIQGKEANGITQQIGATMLPSKLLEAYAKKVPVTKSSKFKAVKKLNVPGLLMIDTPGHESFSNLRSRGSTLCDIAVLVVDIMHGIEQQTRESIKLLQDSKSPFVVALNKIDLVNTDRVAGWKATPNAPFRETLANQSKVTKHLFNERVYETIKDFADLGLYAALYDENDDISLKNQHEGRKTISLVPTSAVTGEGIPDLLMVITQLSQKSLFRRLTMVGKENEFSCSVLEVKKLQGVGFCLDVILVNGTLQVGETIVVGGMQGAIATEVKALLLPKSEKIEMRDATLTNSFRPVKQANAAICIRIQTTDSVEHAMGGSSLFKLQKGYSEEDLEDAKCRAQQMYEAVQEKFQVEDKGVYVVASSLGSLEALLDYLRRGELVDQQAGTWKPVPILGWAIGNVSKKIVMKASVQLKSLREYASILAFNVKIDKKAREEAENTGVRIFSPRPENMTIYNLFNDFSEYRAECQEERRSTDGKAVFPVAMKIEKVIRERDPLLLGCKILRGQLRVGTPIVAAKMVGGKAAPFDLGTVESIQIQGKVVHEATTGQTVAVKFNSGNIKPKPMFKRHFDMEHELVSRISRATIEELKANYRDQMDPDDWALIRDYLKSYFGIP